MKYFLLKPKFVTAEIISAYEHISDKLKREGHTVYNPLLPKQIYRLKEQYDQDCQKHCEYVVRMPCFEDYCLLRFMMVLISYDVLITPAHRYDPSEQALFYYACSIGIYIKEIQV